MRRSTVRTSIALAAASALTAVTVSATAGPASAMSPARGCANGHWQATSYPLGWEPGDPYDPDGRNLMIEAGIAGLVEAFGSLERAVAAFGFADFDAFYAGIADPNFRTVDRNGDGTICFKPAPETSNTPPYYFNTVDNRSNAS